MRGEEPLEKAPSCVGPTTKSWHKSENHNFKIQLSGQKMSGPARIWTGVYGSRSHKYTKLAHGPNKHPIDYSHKN